MGHQSTEYWTQILNEWKRSGLSKVAFCDERKIPISNFYYHLAKTNPAPKSFKKVEIVDDYEEATSAISIVFPSGATMAVSSLTLADLKELLS